MPQSCPSISHQHHLQLLNSLSAAHSRSNPGVSQEWHEWIGRIYEKREFYVEGGAPVAAPAPAAARAPAPAPAAAPAPAPAPAPAFNLLVRPGLHTQNG